MDFGTVFIFHGLLWEVFGDFVLLAPKLCSLCIFARCIRNKAHGDFAIVIVSYVGQCVGSGAWRVEGWRGREKWREGMWGRGRSCEWRVEVGMGEWGASGGGEEREGWESAR